MTSMLTECKRTVLVMKCHNKHKYRYFASQKMKESTSIHNNNLKVKSHSDVGFFFSYNVMGGFVSSSAFSLKLFFRDTPLVEVAAVVPRDCR